MNNLRQNFLNKFVGGVRIILGILFIMTGLMKLFMADYREAWSIQLLEAEIPLYTYNYWFVPILETILGLFLLLGYHSRINAILVLPIIFVAIYVHLTVTDPGAFPSQPQEPYMPIVVILMALIVIIKGAGSWSLDLKSFNKIHE